ncbi:MAG TPA: hypothetical protein DEP23_11730 [Ruminococcaceae bacterium]|nr:hypothetical protein [Oscillospiraceae bacterium]
MRKGLILLLALVILLPGCAKSINLSDNKKQLDPSEKHRLLAMVEEITEPTEESPFLDLSSNAYDYINAHKDIFNNLVGGGQQTADILISELKRASDFGLNQYIMAAICAEITGVGKDDNKAWATAEDWLDLYGNQ